MSTLSDQIRELQKRLEQLSEAEPAAPEQSAMNVASNNIPAASNVQTSATADLPANTNEIPTIEAPTFSQAYAQAKKKGLKKFKWCGVYAVKDRQPMSPPVRPQPAPVPAPVQGVTTNPMGDFDPTSFNGQAAAR